MAEYNDILKIYYDWHTERFFKPKIDGGDGKGFKQMIKYIESLPADVELTLKYIFQNWDDLPEFYQKQTRLRQINSNIHNIIHHFRNGQDTKKRTGVSEDYIKRLVKNISK